MSRARTPRPEDPVLGDFASGDDPDERELNDHTVTPLPDAPLLGGRASHEDMWGSVAMTPPGRATSPPLWDSSSKHPSARQFRVWHMQGGNPSGLGVIDINATEEDFIRTFISAMPKPGSISERYELRPLNGSGKEMGQSISIQISEHHAELQRLRRMAAADADSRNHPHTREVMYPQMPPPQDISPFAEEMGRMLELTTSQSEDQLRRVQEQLDREREELRQMERERARERVDLAERSSGVVQAVTEKMMETEKQRAAEILAQQQQQSQLMLQTITTTFAQQQALAAAEAQRQREADARRLAEEREYREQQRLNAEHERTRQLQEAEAQRRLALEEAERRRERDAAEWERKLQEMRLATEAAERRMQMDVERRREELQTTHKQMEMQAERMRQEAEIRRLEQQAALDRQAQMMRAEAEAAERRRREEIEMQRAQAALESERVREHAKHMLELARLERETARDAQMAKERMEQETLRLQEAERQRQHERMLKEMEQNQQRDREHAERMLKLSQAQSAGPLGGLGGLTDTLGMDTPELLARIFGGGGGDGEEKSGWSDTVAKAASALGEVAKVVLTAKGPPPAPSKKQQAQAAAPAAAPAQTEQMVSIQTEAGPRLITMDQFRGLQEHLMQQQMQAAAEQELVQVLDAPRPKKKKQRQHEEVAAAVEAPQEEVRSEEPAESEYDKASKVDTVARATAAGVSMKDQRDSRKALKGLVAKLKAADESEWEAAVISTAVASPVSLQYIEAVGLLAVCAELRTGEDLAMRFAAALKKYGLSLPITESDVAKKTLAEGEALLRENHETDL